MFIVHHRLPALRQRLKEVTVEPLLAATAHHDLLHFIARDQIGVESILPAPLQRENIQHLRDSAVVHSGSIRRSPCRLFREIDVRPPVDRADQSGVFFEELRVAVGGETAPVRPQFAVGLKV